VDFDSKVADEVHKMLPRFSNLRFVLRDAHDGVGYIRNSHDALQEAYDAGAEKIYYIEDDVVVTRDFFDWHEAVQADGDWMCSTAWRHPENKNQKPHDPEVYFEMPIERGGSTISIGTCFKRDKLKIALRTLDWWPIERMIEEKWRCVMPYVKRCYHVGGLATPTSAVDILPDPIPDYGCRKVVLRQNL
jgi:hypothetical protein